MHISLHIHICFQIFIYPSLGRLSQHVLNQVNVERDHLFMQRILLVTKRKKVIQLLIRSTDL